MRDIEEIVKINAKDHPSSDDGTGWSIQSKDGIIVVRGPEELHLSPMLTVRRVRRWQVDCSNPLNDGPLVQFHRSANVPESVKHQVEMIASQYRRIVHTTEQWADLLLKNV